MATKSLQIILFMVMPLTVLASPSATAPGLIGSGLEIAKAQSATAEIVLPDNATSAEQYAASELSLYLNRISGASFAVVAESKASDRPRLLVGKTRAAQPVLAELKGEDVDTFAVRQVGTDIVLAGVSDRATIYAVYDLLERDLGCRWLAPGPAWEEVPERPQVVLSPVNRIEKPGMKYRFLRMTYLPTGPREMDCLQWAVRQRINVGFEWPKTAAERETLARLGGFRGYMWPHSLAHLTDIKALHAAHPEWFALINGDRPLGIPKNANLCTSDPEVIEFIAKMLSDSFKTQPDLEFLPLGPGDGTSFCQCERCRALDTGAVWSHTDNKQHPALADRWMTFVNEVADRIAVTDPGKKIYSLAYHQTFAPPLKAKPRPNVMMMVVNSRPEGVCFVHPLDTPGCTNNALFRQRFEEWAAITPGGMLAYQYMPHSTFFKMPLPAPHKFVEDIHWLAQAGCIGYEGQSSYNTFGIFNITLYAVVKAMWNPNLEPGYLVEDFCKAGFHNESKQVMAFYLTFKLAQQQAEHSSTGIWTSFQPGVLEEAHRFLTKAWERTEEEVVRRRIGALNAHLTYAEMGLGVYLLSKKAVQERDQQLLDRAVELAREAETRFNTARNADPEFIDLEINPKPFFKLLRAAQAAIKAPPETQPASIEADHEN